MLQTAIDAVTGKETAEGHPEVPPKPTPAEAEAKKAKDKKEKKKKKKSSDSSSSSSSDSDWDSGSMCKDKKNEGAMGLICGLIPSKKE